MKVKDIQEARKETEMGIGQSRHRQSPAQGKRECTLGTEDSDTET